MMIVFPGFGKVQIRERGPGPLQGARADAADGAADENQGVRIGDGADESRAEKGGRRTEEEISRGGVQNRQTQGRISGSASEKEVRKHYEF